MTFAGAVSAAKPDRPFPTRCALRIAAKLAE